MSDDTSQRSLADWLESYAGDHRNPINQALHWICVPLIVWCIIAALWTVPVPPSFAKPGFWAVGLLVIAFYGYYKQSRAIGLGLLVVFAIMALISHVAFEHLGPVTLRWYALGVFVVAWIGQFVGHLFEGRRPSFFTDLIYLLIGPAWLMDKLLRRLGLGTRA
ncbi:MULTISPECIES: DUF962 domain-containing protein [Dyella]|uniref:DUF962 domain-containing protein n=2 Tax=Dyella TaxID=231454 RepID=A0A4R0YI91_9GAMM|nr:MULTISPECIES: Mpo1-like protein [Dyella]TBR36810.1 DUF962 domain-containing protein [Dyella terrae]TCI08099.1 DUF962 domain-containing protein [Dyella soli]